MRYLSVCSGIEAASVAWHPLGWKAVAFAEIEAFPAAVLAAHYPTVPNLGDMTRFHEWPDAIVDVLVGGTPCQSFSVAGLRKGLADARGNLMLTYLAIADRYRPEWLVWENVPGVLSSNGGRDFGTFLGGLAELGYGFAYRVLDAQYFGVPQRRRRVFVVGCLGDWRRAAAVLFERESLRGNPAPSREKGKGIAPTISARTQGGGGLGTDFDCDGGLLAFGGNNTGGPIDVATACQAHGGPYGRLDFGSETFIAHSLRADGFDASADGTGRGTPLVPVSHALDSYSAGGRGGIGVGAVAFTQNQRDEVRELPGIAMSRAGEPGMKQQTYVAFNHQAAGKQTTLGANTLGANTLGANTLGANTTQAVATAMQVRRLTPRECERLQGFPDDYTLIRYRGKPAADGPRYKALGNSMAVPCMRWIGERIAAVAEIARAKDAA